MSTVHPAQVGSVPRKELVGWSLGVIVANLALPGAGIALALAVVLTRLRKAPTPVRVGLVALAVAVVVVQTIGLLSLGGPTTVVSPASKV